MKRCLLLLIGGVAWYATGCNMAVNITRNLVNEPCQCVDNICLHWRCKHQAKDAWRQYAACHAEVPFSPHFADGFRDGYADYLWRGGHGEPPAVPPKYYTRKKYANYEGYLAIEEWYAGWRVGAAEAIASGRRQLLVVPVLLPVPTNGIGQYQSAFNPAGSPLAGGAGTGPAVGESLPAPRPMPAAPWLPY